MGKHWMQSPSCECATAIAAAVVASLNCRVAENRRTSRRAHATHATHGFAQANSNRGSGQCQIFWQHTAGATTHSLPRPIVMQHLTIAPFSPSALNARCRTDACAVPHCAASCSNHVTNLRRARGACAFTCTCDQASLAARGAPILAHPPGVRARRSSTLYTTLLASSWLLRKSRHGQGRSCVVAPGEHKASALHPAGWEHT